MTEVEPLDKDSPLWDMDNVIITPHVAGVSQRRFPRLVGFFCANLKKYLAGEPLDKRRTERTRLLAKEASPILEKKRWEIEGKGRHRHWRRKP